MLDGYLATTDLIVARNNHADAQCIASLQRASLITLRIPLQDA